MLVHIINTRVHILLLSDNCDCSDAHFSLPSTLTLFAVVVVFYFWASRVDKCVVMKFSSRDL